MSLSQRVVLMLALSGLCLAPQARGDGDPDAAIEPAEGVLIRQFIKDLAEDEPGKRLTAFDKLAARGASARDALETFVGPPRKVVTPDPTPAQQSEIAALIRQLSDPSYEARRDASARLRKLGAMARPALEQALRDADPERRQRARALLRTIDPAPRDDDATRRARGLAALLLGRIADARSEPALRHLLERCPDGQAAAYAAVALRSIRRAGAEPLVMPLWDTEKELKERRRIWKTWLDEAPARRDGVEPLVLKAPVGPAPKTALVVDTKITWSLDLSVIFQNAPGGMETRAGSETTTKASFAAAPVDGEPTLRDLRCTSYREVTQQQGGPGLPQAFPGGNQATDADWNGKRLQLDVGTGALRLGKTADATPAYSNMRQSVQLALLLAALLPRHAAGTYQPAQPRPLPSALFEQLQQGMYAGAPFETKLAGSSGRLTYLGPGAEGQARFYCELFLDRQAQNSMFLGPRARPVLQGEVVLDIASARVVKLSLDGPAAGVAPLRARIGGSGRQVPPMFVGGAVSLSQQVAK